LAGRIPRPVRIILCGYDPTIGVNPHYVYLAKKTGGGIYTINNDFEELKAEIGENGAITSFEDLRIKLTAPQCFNGDILRVNSINYTLKTSRFKSKKVRILNMNNEDHKAIPNRVFKMENLQVLDASNNQLSLVSEDIQKLHYLSNLNLSKNALTTLPNSIINLPFIEYIDISENQLKEVPRELYGMKFLKTVDLSFNSIQKIDRFESRYLQDLNLSNNQLKDISSFRKNVEIYSLNLSGNQFTKAPTELPNSLRKLDLSNNKLTSLPMDLTPYADLEVLILTGNDFSIVEQERIRAILFYTDLQF
jgi:Leucine-rich repeat (LRR) protein